MRDRRAIDRNAEPLGGVEVRQLPQAAEQAVCRAARDDDLTGLLDPDVRAREERKLVLLLSHRHHRQLVLTTGPPRRAQLRERADEAAR